jgi:hypothetical protein
MQARDGLTARASARGQGRDPDGRLLKRAGRWLSPTAAWSRRSDVTGIRETLFGWVMVGLAGLAIVVMLAAAVTQFVAWAGAVINPGGLNDKTWFIILLVAGLFSFGFIAMIGT